MIKGENKGFYVELIEGCLHCSFEYDIIIKESTVLGLLSFLDSEFKDWKSLGVIIDLREVKYFLKKGKDLLFSVDGLLVGQPVAVIMNSFIVQTSVNFVLENIEHSSEVRYCVSVDKALSWMNSK